MNLFTGCYTHAIDAKNRVSVPRKMVDALRALGSPDEVVLTAGLDRCLFLHTPEGFAQLGKQLESSPLGQLSTRDVQRNFYASAESCSIDRTGRLVLPETLKGLVGITDRVVFAGVGQRVELWNPEEWNTRQQQSRDTYDKQASDVFR